MNNQTVFLEEESDIVQLFAPGGGHTADGWVNVGTHAVKIENNFGQLTVEIYARTNEGYPLRSVTVPALESREAGGVDPDEAPLNGE